MKLTGYDSKLDEQLLSQRGSTSYYLSTPVPVIHRHGDRNRSQASKKHKPGCAMHCVTAVDSLPTLVTSKCWYRKTKVTSPRHSQFDTALRNIIAVRVNTVHAQREEPKKYGPCRKSSDSTKQQASWPFD